MNFVNVVETAVKRLEKDGIFLGSSWSISFDNSADDKKALWNVADNVRTAPGKSKLCPKDGYRLAFVGSETDELGFEDLKYFAFIGDDGGCLFVRSFRDWRCPVDGGTVLISPKVPEYMLKKFTQSPELVAV